MEEKETHIILNGGRMLVDMNLSIIENQVHKSKLRHRLIVFDLINLITPRCGEYRHAHALLQPTTHGDMLPFIFEPWVKIRPPEHPCAKGQKYWQKILDCCSFLF